VSHVDDSSRSSVLSGINNKLEGNLHFVSNVFAADLILAEAECAALLGASWASSPADGANTIGTVLARCVAESTTRFLVFMTGQGSDFMSTAV